VCTVLPAACANTWRAAVQDIHLDSSTIPYAITASDLTVQTTEKIANIANGSIVLSAFTFALPERTGIQLASGQIQATVYCPKVENSGCTEASVAGADGNSTCIGCAGAVFPVVTGLGAWVSTGNHTNCSCSDSGVASTHSTIYHAQAANPHYFTPENVPVNNCANTSNASVCLTAHAQLCGAACACDAVGNASGPTNCTCSCKQNMCNTMNQYNTSAEEGSNGVHGTNCSCSDSGVVSGQVECGCSCSNSTTYHAEAAIPHYFTPENAPVDNCTYESNASACATAHAEFCGTACTCDAAGIASGPTNCTCSCDQGMCNTMNQNNTAAEEGSNSSHGTNCSCSDSGIVSGQAGCGCSCTNSTTYHAEAANPHYFAPKNTPVNNCTYESNASACATAHAEFCGKACTCDAAGNASGPTNCTCSCNQSMCNTMNQYNTGAEEGSSSTNCSCSDSGNVSGHADCGCSCTNSTTYSAQAANPHYFTPKNTPVNNCTYEAILACSTALVQLCGTACACDDGGNVTGPSHCTCSCKQNMCNTMDYNHTAAEEGSQGSNGTNCSCSDSGVVSGQDRCGCSCSNSTTYSAQAANPHYFTPENTPVNNCTDEAILACSTAHAESCGNACACGDAGNVSGPVTGPNHCTCSCKQNMCNAMNQNYSAHGTNCSCSDSGVVSVKNECGCSCKPTIYLCACDRKTCGSQASSDSKTFTSTNGQSTSGGGTCQVEAACNSGFYDGGVFTAYSNGANVRPELFGPDGPISSSYLGSTPLSQSTGGVFHFANLMVTNYAEAYSKLYLKFHAGSSGAKILTSLATASFAAWPTKFKVTQTADANKAYFLRNEYKVNARGFADLGNYSLYLLDSNNAVISGVSSTSGFNATASLITGPNSDSSSKAEYSSNYTDVTLNLSLFSRVTQEKTADLKIEESSFMKFGMHVVERVGRSFGVVFAMENITDTTKYVVLEAKPLETMPSSSSFDFGIVAGKIQVAYGEGKTVFGLNTAPNIVKVDGGNTNATMNVDGLPNPLHVLFQDGAGATLKHGSCTDCVMVRLMQCTDATGKASSASTNSTAYPTCSTVAQAKCAGSSGTKCKSTVSNSWLDTLTGTTLVNMVDGVATFPDLQLSHVVGAGYKLQFTLNANGRNTVLETVTLNSSPADTQVDFPNLETNLNNSFFVRPYALGILQNIGGDGVKKPFDNNIPSGVGNGFPFRYQPIVNLKGKGYDFDSTTNVHGWTPITAEIKTCGRESCATKNLKLSGSTSAPSWNFKSFDANTGMGSDPVTQQAIVHMRYRPWDSSNGILAMSWLDLIVHTNDTATWQGDVVVTFKVGPGPTTGTLPATYTSIDSNSFDVFTFPEPPRNLRVHSYSENGFRVEFDPAPISPAQPLSGFIIEMDVCEQDATRCTKRGTLSSATCVADKALNKSDACFAIQEGLGRSEYKDFGFQVGLGSDVTSGGGYTEDVLLNFTGATAGDDSAVNFYINPSKSLYAGDQFVLDLGKSYKFRALKEFTVCVFTGPDAESIMVSSFDDSTLILRVAANKILLATKPVLFSAPETCKIKMPPKGNTTHGFTQNHPPPTIIHAPVLGAPKSSRGDNCKGTTAGCVAKTTYILQTIQDSNPADVDWSGALHYGGAGLLNIGAPFLTSDENCKSGRPGATKMCALSIGQDWSMGVDVSLNWSPPQANETVGQANQAVGQANEAVGQANETVGLANETVGQANETVGQANESVGQANEIVGQANEIVGLVVSYPLFSVNFTRDRALAGGDWIDFPVPGMGMDQPEDGTCLYFVERGAKAGPVNFSTVKTGGLADFTETNILCAKFVTEVNMIADATVGGGVLQGLGWETYFDPETSVMSIYVGSAVLANTMMNVKIRGFSATPASRNVQSPGPIDATVRRGKRTTVIFENGADTVTYSTSGYDPVGSKNLSPKRLIITAGEIYSFRVYAYNSRFMSSAISTQVQNRAIQKPASPAYFSQIKQEVLPAELRFNNLHEGYVMSNKEDGSTKNPFFPGFNAATRVGLKITPNRDVKQNSILSITLPAFMSDIAYMPISNTQGTKLFQDVYDVVGEITHSLNTSRMSNESSMNNTLTQHGCTCDANGGIFTPRNKYRVTRRATGSDAVEFVSTGWADDVITNFPAPSSAVPAKSCGECSCSLAGVATTPASIFNTTGNCTSCKCDGSGVSSHVAPWQVSPQAGEDASVVCSDCSCSVSGVISATSNGNCSQCMCRQQACACACPLFRECTCGCELYESYKCGCNQDKASNVFSNALWSTSERALLLTVDQNAMLRKDVPETVWISTETGLRTPATVQEFDANYELPEPGAWGFQSEFRLQRFHLNWVSSFPTILAPRLGFVVQFTTDLFWKTNIQTVYFPDDLSEGVAFAQPIAPLSEDVPITATSLTIGAPWLRRGQHIMIDSEIMRVKESNVTHLVVDRGEHGSVIVAHSSGVNVSLVQIGATDPAIEDGIDNKVGPTGKVGCRLGNPAYVAEGCNPSNRIFPSSARIFSSGDIVAGETPQASLVGACSGNATFCSTGCKCISTPAALGADLGSPRPRGSPFLASPGDVLSYPLDFRGRLVHAVSTSTTNMMLDSSTQLVRGKYLRIGVEIMFVLAVGETATGLKQGVKSIGTFRASGGAECTCSIAGVASPSGGSCSCNGDQGANCTAAGTLKTLEGSGGGRGFAGTFTVDGGKITSITVTDPGEGYTTFPRIVIATGGGNCVVQFFASLSAFTATVLRAQLGTVAATHTAASKVSTVLWASQSVANKPTKRYSFRLAAYNQAGMSDFLYYDLQLKGKNMRLLLPQGNQLLELSLVGGGVVSSPRDLTVTLVTPGTTDITKGKACTSVSVLDLAGTRLTCRTPKWVGAKLDLIVSYTSGMFSNFNVGAGWVAYAPPTLTGLVPALTNKAVPNQPIVITVSGTNFGITSADVTGKLVGSFLTDGELPCAPLVVVTNTQILCTLTTKAKEDQLVGDMIITAGNDLVHGGGQKTVASKFSKMAQKAQPVEVRATIAADFTAITSSPAKVAEFKNTFVAETSSALGIPAYLLEILSILQGSVIVIFNILPDTSSTTSLSPAALAVNLAAQAADPNSALRRGSLTGAMTVSLPPGTAELAVVSTTQTASAAIMPLYFTKCVPRSYTAWDMEICYDCCTYLCETGTEIPQMGGQDVLPGYRAGVCQSECMTYCGYARPLEH